MKKDFLLSSYHYNLPPDSIAQVPSNRREESRLLVLHKETGSKEHLRFREISRFFKKGDCLVINKTRVFPARIVGKKPTGGRIEFLLLELPREKGKGMYKARALCRSSKPARPGTTVTFSDLLEIVVKKKYENGQVDILLNIDENFPGGLLPVLEKVGRMPLPPYIKREDRDFDRTRYQTVYAQDVGSVAAPTAGLHFNEEILESIRERGVKIAPVTLHVGYGTFSPIRTEDIRKHKIHSEWVSVKKQSAQLIKGTKKSGGRIFAVGTTSVRTIEFVYKEMGDICEFSGPCDLYIYPGFRFHLTDAMLTNFHLPCSSLLVLVSAFAGRQRIIQTYEEAIRRGYRFFSYGDAMLIL